MQTKTMMNSLLKIEVSPVLSMTQKEAATALGGVDVLRQLEELHGLKPWYCNATLRRYSVASIQAALDRAEQANTLTARVRRPRG